MGVRVAHGGSNSGRYVIISNTPREHIRSTDRPTASRLVGSIQCTSSKIISTGLERDSASSCAVSASSVFCLRCCGAGPAGRVIGMKTFGASAPLKELDRKFGFEPERVVAVAMELLGRS